ncbi:hypothetical protein EKO27_g5577 [Xylaria grammica]|uniref:Methyltransferase n=1 Tax=Xylaria grammica TaxID=363999 RepID=A0A439D544_9PEZI|nr:hypothetical protein EKO27_g5577 [Xylaria grammica]
MTMYPPSTDGRDKLAEHLEAGRPFSFWFLTRGLYQETRPYIITFDPTELGIKKTNHEFTEHKIVPSDARGSMKSFDIGVHGFQFESSWGTCLQSPDFDDESKVKAIYYPEITSQFCRLFPHFSHVEVLGHLRRKNRPVPTTPQPAGGEEPCFPAPITVAHLDYTTAGARVAMRELLGEKPHLLSKHVSIINVWRVTKGPNEDWPLALCDFRTVRQEDAEVSDVIHRDIVGESMRLYFHPAQRWHFLANQDVTEVTIFRNADTSERNLPIAFHTAFENPYADPDKLRESIEVRLACFYD